MGSRRVASHLLGPGGSGFGHLPCQPAAQWALGLDAFDLIRTSFEHHLGCLALTIKVNRNERLANRK